MRRSPLVRGSLWALVAALTFGVTTPLVSRSSGGAGSWFVAAALYGGAALFAGTIAGSPRAACATLRRNARAYATLAIIGGMLAPAAFTAGLARAGPLASSLALNLEVIFSIVLAVAIFKEHIGRRVILAGSLILGGGALLAARNGATTDSAWGIGLVIVATALWATDNAISASLRDADTRVTVFWKSLLGASFALVVSRTLHETMPSPSDVASLVGIGAIGYGASIWCYLRAQRTFGVARTASIFAIAPFVGAVASIAIEATSPGPMTYVVFALMAAGVLLHTTERHAHRHRHRSLEHDHLHRHDDEHHAHRHDDAIVGAHTHPHRHDEIVHDHAHAPDPHHAHDHAIDGPATHVEARSAAATA